MPGNPGGNNQYGAQHLDESHGMEPVKILVPGTALEPAYFCGLWNLSSFACAVYLFDGGPDEQFLMGDALVLEPGKNVDLGSPGFPLTGSGLWVRVVKPIAPGAKLHVLVR